MAKLNNSKDLIYRGDVYDALMQRATPLIGGGIASFVVDYPQAVDSVQAIDARPVVYGNWIRRQSWSDGGGMGSDFGFYWECSNCRSQTKGDYDECGCKFCPNCGADMC